MLRLRGVAVAGLLLFGPAQARAQDTTYTRQAFERLMARLGADPGLPDSLRPRALGDLVGLRTTSHFALLDDSSSTRFLLVMARTLHLLPDSICGSLFQAGPTDSSDLAFALPWLDRAAVDEWVVILERVVRGRAAPHLAGPAATFDEVQATLLRLVVALPGADQERLQLIALHPPPGAGDLCWSTRLIMDGLGTLAPAEAGPLVRAMFPGRP